MAIIPKKGSCTPGAQPRVGKPGDPKPRGGGGQGRGIPGGFGRGLGRGAAARGLGRGLARGLGGGRK